uniref:fatty acid desaturase n=1 Tax=Burkholderia diffusa TaxID=488732 RepID=UPI001CC6FA0E|nr:fatty acid desaturase [Burkholderia diffusa]
MVFPSGHPWLFLLTLIAVILAGDRVLGEDVKCHSGVISAAVPIAFICLWLMAVFSALMRAKLAMPAEVVGLVTASGILSAFAMAHIHEVMHRGHRLSRGMSDIALTIAGYPHYRLVHELHHSNVGDPRYGSTAHAGLSVWRHVGRSFGGAAIEALAFDRERGRQGCTRRLLTPAMAWIGVVTLVSVICGHRGVLFYLGQSGVSVFVVEAIGYMQHYGLDNAVPRREQQIAWDVSFWLSNRLFVNNGRHTHHHLEQTQPYSRLARIGDALPGGYLEMFLLALIPPLWFALMDRKLEVNVHSSRK